MPIAYWSILVACLLPILTLAPAKIGGRFDNARPRDPDFWADPYRARVWAASQNGFEALPFFIASVIIAVTQGAPGGLVDLLAIGFVLARLGYVAAYYADRPRLRSLLWSIGFLAALAIFLSPLTA